MFARKLKTVATIMQSFRTAITDLEEIITRNNAIVDTLHAQRNLIDGKIEDVDLEILTARGTADRMSDLVFGPDVDATDCGGGCTSAD